MKGVEIKKLKMQVDSRGWLAEIFRPADVHNTMKGQITLTTANPGAVKANHYHKKLEEWYCVIKGKMHLVLKNVKTGEKEEFILSGDNLKILKIPSHVAHGFKNIGDDMLFVLLYLDKPFNPDDNDTYPEIVIS